MKKQLNTLKKIEITWIDSTWIGGWSNGDRCKKYGVSNCRSVGYLVRKDKKEILIGQSYDDNGNIGNITVVPISQVKGIKNV